MEPAWSNVDGRNFTLSEYTDSTNRKLPMYDLSKNEDYVSHHKIVEREKGGPLHARTHEFNGNI